MIKRKIALILCTILAMNLCACAKDMPTINQVTTETTLNIQNESNTGASTAPEIFATEKEEYYSVCTYRSKAEVEEFAKKIKGYILEKDWESLSEYISYPISIGGYSYDSKDSFATGEFANLLNEEFYDAVENESCTEMFCNWQGIMLGDGEVWLAELNGLKVISINATYHVPEATAEPWTMLETIFMPIAEGEVGNSHDEVTSLLTENGFVFYEGEDGAALQAPDPERIPGNLFGDINSQNEYTSLTYYYVIPEEEIHRMGLYRGVRVEFEGDSVRYFIRANRYKKGMEVASAQELWDYITDPEQRYDETPEGHYRAMMEDVLSGRETVGSMDLRDENLCGELTISDYINVFSQKNGMSAAASQIATVDMDGDGMKEVLLRLTENNGEYNSILVLHYDDRLVYAQSFASYELHDLKTDGTFQWYGKHGSSGAAYMNFAEDFWFRQEIATEEKKDYSSPDNTMIHHADRTAFSLDESISDEEAYRQAMEIQKSKEDAHWGDYPCENLGELLKGTY